MSNCMNLNASWKFKKDTANIPEGIPTDWETVTIPHTWNGTDGQDGGNDYFRGTCCYVRELEIEPVQAGEQVYLEFCGSNSSADLYINGTKAAHHDGGYSTWRVNITEYIKEQNVVAVAVDNAPNNTVYPQMADFTFYGGIYRDVNLIRVGESHFDLDHFGGPAIKVTPQVNGSDAQVTIETYLTGQKEGQNLVYRILDAGVVIGEKEVPAQESEVQFTIENVHLWNARKDPYLYTAQVVLVEDGKELDSRTARFGCRTFEIDPQKGFILNGEAYPLRGVSRHQDRPEIGNALLPEHHKEDMDFICELGANTIRLAHYQHDQYFYDLCDEKGMVVWAEIPYISEHLPDGRENTMLQMKELIIQNYNHPSIVVWGLSNEITMRNGAKDESLLENHYALNDLVHSMDATRLTTEAVVTICDMDEEYVHIPDVVSYNHYYGWYGGSTDMNGAWFDKFHEKYPNRAIGISEYGCEALNWHTSNPVQGDYTEEYQAYYHEELIRQIDARPYLWATHVWNMYDFAADSRAEGGESGMNHKGLMTFDRKYKKDAFFAYKAWLSDEPFVHICGKRYVKRVEDITKVTVYTNQPEVELFANGKSLGKQQRKDLPFFYFEVPNAGETTLTAIAGDYKDESKIEKVAEFPEEYRMKEEGEVLNWFEITTPDGFFSINDLIGDIMDTQEGNEFMMNLFKSVFPGTEEEGQAKDMMSGIKINDDMLKMIKGFTVKRCLAMMSASTTKEQYLQMNESLNKISKNK